MNWITVVGTEGKQLWVNMDNVTMISPHHLGASIHFVDDTCTVAIESPDSIIEYMARNFPDFTAMRRQAE